MGTRQLDASAADFLAELVEARAANALQPDEFTITDYVAKALEQTGKEVGRNSASRHLDALVEKGILTKRMARHDGRMVRAYRRVNGTETRVSD